ncbi:MAG TPA: hypothetical protein VKZ50_01470 [bacterium]|nr:hypothetical protein [bacterium]
MDTGGFRRWFDTRKRIASSLVAADRDNALFDAEILLCCAMGAIAAIMWPGDRIDRRRYVELLIRYARVIPKLTMISVPALVDQLDHDPGYSHISASLREKFFPKESSRIVDAFEIDKEEPELRAAEPALSAFQIRKASYAAIVYTDLRSGLVHEFAISGSLADWSMRLRDTVPHYMNWVTPPHKRLFLPYQYVFEIAESTAKTVGRFWDTCSTFAQPLPAKWWIEG